MAGFMRIIDPVDLAGIDLNLLVSLRGLLTQRHVTRSAEKLGLTQPAMSASLARSRTLFRVPNIRKPPSLRVVFGFG
jgi:hypothetical protein